MKAARARAPRESRPKSQAAAPDLKNVHYWNNIMEHDGICIHNIYIYMYIIEGSLEVKLPTIWTVEKQR